MARKPNIKLGNLEPELGKFIDDAMIILKGKRLYYLEERTELTMKIFRCEQSTAKNYFKDKQLSIPSLSVSGISALKKFFDDELDNFKKVAAQTNNAKIAAEKIEALTTRLNNLIEKLNKEFNDTDEEESNLYKRIVQKTYTAIPKIFYSSPWLLFERHESKGKEIGRKVVIFKEGIDKNTCRVVLTPSLENLHEWLGEAKYISAERMLVVTLFNTKSGNNYQHLIIQVEDRSKKLDICIGHLTFRNTEHDNIVTKAVVLEKTSGAEQELIGKRFDLASPEVSENIRLFLSVRALNRLSSPHQSPIFDHDTLGTWLMQNNTTSTGMYKALEGKYSIFYWTRPDERILITDTLTLTAVSDHEFDAIYSHDSGEDDTTDYWRGKAYINLATHTINMYLKGPQESPNDTPALNEAMVKPIFLIIDIPPQERRNIEILVGIASGPRDADRGVVARLIVLKMDSAVLPEDFGNSLTLFFEKFSDRLRVRPPSKNKVYNLKTFKKAIDDGKPPKQDTDK